jgi:hypothetical protein
MTRKLKGGAIVDSSVTGTQIETTLVNKITNAYNQANAAYGQANTGSTSGADAYNQANAAYGQANNARSDANTTFATINTTFGTVNTSLGTVNTSLGTINTNYQAAYAQANTARTTANDAYAAANTKVNATGGSITGDLSITGNLTVQGNATTINVSNLSVNDSIMLLASGGTGDSLDIGFVGHIQRDAVDTHVGLIRKAVENQFYLFDNYEVEPTNNIINVSGNNFRLANLKLGIANANTFVTSAGLDVTGQANAAYGQANAAYGAANNRVLKAGDTMTGNLTMTGTQPSIRLQESGSGGDKRLQLSVNSAGVAFVSADQSSQELAFTTVGSERIRITSGGNVGIGTNSPVAKFDVWGDITLDSASATDRTLYFRNQSASTGGLIKSDQSLSFHAGSSGTPSHVMTLQRNTLNVGIGTTNPSQRLHVVGGNALFNNNGSGDTNSGLRIVSAVATTHTNWKIGVQDIISGIDITPSTAAGGTTFSTPAVVINTSSQVGIGTVSPRKKLDIVGTLFIEGGSANWSQTTPGTTVGSIHLDPGSTTDDFGSAITWGASDQSSGEDAQAGIYVRSDGGYGTKMYFATTDNYSTGSKVAMMIDHQGEVGIGTTNPLAKLDVVGNAYVRSGIFYTDTIYPYSGNELRLLQGGSNYVYINGNVTVAGTITESSSITIKENINPITNALDIISQLSGVTYDRIDGSAKKRAGLIAEEVDQVLPNVVQKDEHGNPSGIQYTNLIAYLVESIKELKAEIDTLKGK